MLCQMRRFICTNLWWAQGQASDIEIQAKEILRLKAKMNRIMADATGQTIEQIDEDTNRDVYKTAEEAVTYGLVDEVLEMPDKK